MIIQNSSPMNQAVQPDVRASSPTSARAESKPVTASPAQSNAAQASTADVKSAVEAINQSMRQANRNLEFSVDADSHRTVVKMVDTSTGELIRQYPSEEALAISRNIDKFQQGLLLTQKA